MFLGEYETSTTAGNRVAIPKKFRDQLTSGFILTRGYEGCIVLVDRSNFENLLDGVSDVPFISADKRETARFLLSGAHEVEPDKQGRVVLPASLIKHADLDDGQVVFIGVGKWIEVWSKAKWYKYQKQLDKQSVEIADRLSRLRDETEF